MRVVSMILLLTLCLLPMAVVAKRTPPPKVEPVVYEGVRYCAPNDNGRVAYVEAYDASTGKKLWQKTIFENVIDPSKEEDVQWVFIKSIEIIKGDLMIVDENENRYSLNLRTHEVKKQHK